MIILLENEISTFARQGKILLMGDMNAKYPDFIIGDSCQINNFDAENLIPDCYEVDTEISRNNQDNITNVQCKSLLELCIASRLRILDGRFIGDSLGYYTYMSINGYRAVDYALISESLLSSVKYFKTDDFAYLSDHVQIQLTLNRNIKNKFDLKSHIEKKMERFEKISMVRTENSQNLLLETLTSEYIKNYILNFELNEYEENQKGVDGATENLTNIFENISEITCKISKRFKNSFDKKPKDYWEILKGMKNKKDVGNEVPEILKDEEIITKYIQDQGKPTFVNIKWKEKIENNLFILKRTLHLIEKQML
ncbi:unnamed protein product [Mytilus coruscus]|uniref:Endonuclease/exonuclease/phosphatase domain-containing protein n=1 Tax=Mytilus coruscus TaxID=42192 RepID=A0A6J8EBA0_MYTCO|nr:unnamed protein product [Mytilus coruscus]